jgi:mannose-6-phosphate isomerase-like protein (cupin superfamily)
MLIGLMVKDLEAYQDLALGLKENGHQVQVFSISQPLGALDYQAMAAFMHTASGFDVIHNIIGPAPIMFSRFIRTPLLTTLDGFPSDDELAIYRQLSERCYFAAIDKQFVVPGLRFLFVLEPGMDRLGACLSAYERIHQENRSEEQRPWGFYRVLSDQNDHKVKQITVWPGKRLSLQSHQRRAEHWLIVSGQARVTLNAQYYDLEAQEAIDIPRGAAHRIQNIGQCPLVFIEVQQGEYFGEDDITRLEDDFGRT